MAIVEIVCRQLHRPVVSPHGDPVFGVVWGIRCDCGWFEVKRWRGDADRVLRDHRVMMFSAGKIFTQILPPE